MYYYYVHMYVACSHYSHQSKSHGHGTMHN